MDAFHLPSSAPWLFVTDSTHLQKYTLDSNGSKKSWIGITMRRSTRGIIAMNIKLALSHGLETGRTCGILLGCSDAQTDFIVMQLESCASFAWHPLLLPCLFTEYHHNLLSGEAAKLWGQLLRVETVSGQTGAPAKDLSMYDDSEFADTTNSILGVVQLATAWESNTHALLLGVDVIKDGLAGIKKAAPDDRSGAVKRVTEMLSEHLELTAHKSKVVLSDLQYITARAQAQTNAVYNLLARQGNLVGQRIAAQSLDTSEASRQVAVATKRDSSAMKAIAILTMTFLPGTYISTFFAAPFLDFSTPSRLPLPRPTFWLYWAVTAPSTVFIVSVYLLYAALIKRRHKQEDKKTQEAVRAANGKATERTA
ncbi:uncharacterized protein BDR25DRAFT_303806 [Lindgomyces ingoldianus]|uniref:Uncharacterized protein n=1 Tax=Lindgomyces ingoldianus TaxID=673940 RepID=A0ACB6QUT0_9PLEO|nr:uncharacterized protein BDR25DRAFT_303806 [Lindgomyces ingoldianus]KAF2470260.1 hypothetical protein BDR25DRAFT_303806 [Lindgomyces ingoldianus]